jgi:uncharacterized protein (TIGR00251 family)
MAGAGSVPGWLREQGGAVTLELLIQPRASRTRVVGEHDGRLKVQLAAPPVDGEANAALVELLAGALGVRESEVEVLRGDPHRLAPAGLAAEPQDGADRGGDGGGGGGGAGTVGLTRLATPPAVPFPLR